MLIKWPKVVKFAFRFNLLELKKSSPNDKNLVKIYKGEIMSWHLKLNFSYIKRDR